jgi:hypothetical protein
VEPAILQALKALTDATRLRIVGRLAAGPASLEDLAADLGLPLSVLVRHVGILRRAALIGPAQSARDTALILRIDTLQSIGRALDDRERASFDPDVAPDDAKVLRGYLEHGRLTAIPAQTGKRLVLLRWLRDQVFVEDREYPEKEVNQRLALFHPDVASLRRYMVDARLVTRERGLYRRAGPLAEAEPSRAAEPFRDAERSGV